MLTLFKRLFKRKRQPEVLHGYAVETILMLDEGSRMTKLNTFVAIIHAKSKKDAKERIRTRAFVKVGNVANKAEVEQFVKDRK